MGKTVDFIVVFDDGVRKRHYYETEKGRAAYFAVLFMQLRGIVLSL